MAKPARLPSGNWSQIVTVNGQRKRVTEPTLAACRRAAAEMEVRMGGTPGANGNVTVDELLDTYMANTTLSATYRADVESARTRYLPPKFAARPLRKVTPAVVEGLHAEMATNGATVHRVLRLHRALSAAWTMGQRYGWASDNPFRIAAKPPEPIPQVRPPTIDELARLYAKCPPNLLLYMELAELIGARRGELIGLQWPDVGDMSIMVQRSYSVAAGVKVVTEGKSGRAGWRPVAIDAEMAAALKAHRVAQVELALSRGLPAPLWVWSKDAGVTPWRPEWPTNQFAKVRKAAKVPDVVKLHGMRHSMVSVLLAAGVSTTTTAKRVGHTREATTTDKYAHLIPAADQAAAEIMAKVRRDRKTS